MKISEEQKILDEIKFCKARINGLKQRIGSLNTQIGSTDVSIGSVEFKVKNLQQDLWWLRFIRFCNTPCWRFCSE